MYFFIFYLDAPEFAANPKMATAAQVHAMLQSGAKNCFLWNKAK